MMKNKFSRSDTNQKQNNVFRYSAFDTAAYYLGFKDRTSSELSVKLTEKGYSEEEISEAIDKLKNYGYVDDSRYARAYIKQYSRSKGKRLLVGELLQKGIDKETIYEETDNLQFDEQQIIEGIFSKRFLQADLYDDKQYRRIYSYFVRRGFGYDDINKIIAKYRKNN